MDPESRLKTLQQEWRPPAELERSRPREVRLTAGGKALLHLSVALLAAGIAAGVLLHGKSAREREEARLLVEQGVASEGSVTRLWRSGDKNKTHWVAYGFVAGDRACQGRSRVSRSLWNQLQVGSILAIRYVPFRPELNSLRDVTPGVTPPWLPFLLAILLTAVGLLATLPVSSQRRLLQEGRPALAVVTRHEKSSHGPIVHYSFTVLSGAQAHGKTGPTRKPPALESRLCILYDPEKPRRNQPYPLSLVRAAYAPVRDPRRGDFQQNR